MIKPSPYSLLLCFILTISSHHFIAAQPQNSGKTDSLERLLVEETVLNEVRVDRLNQLGYEYWIAAPGASIKYGNRALEIAKILPYEAGAAYANRIIGVAHWAQGNLDLSFRYLIAARKGYQDLEDALGVANSSLNLGMAYADQRNFDLANRNYEDALQFFRQEGADSRIATTYTKIADLLISLEKHVPAFDYLNQALVIHSRTGFLYGVAEANQKLGQLAMAQEEWDDAISYFLLAAEAGKQRNDQVGLAGNYLGIGKAYFAKNDLNLADNYLERARHLAETFGLQRIRRDVYLALKQLETRRSNFPKALRYADVYLNVRDSLFNYEKSNLIANMESRRAYEAQEKELVLAQKNLDISVQENKVNRLTKWMLVLGLLTAIAIAYAMLSGKDRVIARKQADLKEANQRGENLETALKGKEQELTSYTLNFVHKNEGITALKLLIQDLSKKVDKEHKPEIKSIVRKLDGLLRMDEDWADFRRHFESVHPDLINRLGEEFPGLTGNEFRLIALIRLNLSTKEISSVLGISPDSVKTARYRLRKKLNLETQDGLFDFLLQFER
jgi:DNA-binding CsgD family transcriptional regulator/Tfp pilus assembly protein PilF